jgi:hypothetical protein
VGGNLVEQRAAVLLISSQNEHAVYILFSATRLHTCRRIVKLSKPINGRTRLHFLTNQETVRSCLYPTRRRHATVVYNKKVGTMARHNIVLWTVDTERMSPAALGQRKPAGIGPGSDSSLPSTAVRTATAQRLLRLRGASAASANAVEAERGLADTSAQATGTRASATTGGRRAATACRGADPWRSAWSGESETVIEAADNDDD